MALGWGCGPGISHHSAGTAVPPAPPHRSPRCSGPRQTPCPRQRSCSVPAVPRRQPGPPGHCHRAVPCHGVKQMTPQSNQPGSPSSPPTRPRGYPVLAGGDGDSPGAVYGSSQGVDALAGEVEVPPVEGAVPGASPGQTGGRGAAVPGGCSSRWPRRGLSCGGETPALSKRPAEPPGIPSPRDPGPTGEGQAGADETRRGRAVPPAVPPRVPATLSQAHGREVAAAGVILALPRTVALSQQTFACGTGMRRAPCAGDTTAAPRLNAHPHLPSVQRGPLQPWQQPRTVRFHATGRISGGLQGMGSRGVTVRVRGTAMGAPTSSLVPRCSPVDVAEWGARAMPVGFAAVSTVNPAHAFAVDVPTSQAVMVELGAGHHVLASRRHLLLRRHLHRPLTPMPAATRRNATVTRAAPAPSKPTGHRHTGPLTPSPRPPQPPRAPGGPGGQQAPWPCWLRRTNTLTGG